MAARKFHHDHTRRFLYLDTTGHGGDPITINPIDTAIDAFELNESDVWNVAGVDDQSHPNPIPRRSNIPLLKSHQKRRLQVSPAAKSLPVNVPDWSEILREEYKVKKRSNGDGDLGFDGKEEDGEKLPPHEYLARTRIASFSVHEGAGRTLKGRDLSRVRNAIWKQTGFELD